MNQKRQERRILVAQIGRGNYQILDYAQADPGKKGAHGTKRTYGYSFEAVYEQFCQDVPIQTEHAPVGAKDALGGSEHTLKDVILLVGTAASFWGSLCAYYMERDTVLENRKNRKPEEAIEDLKKDMRRVFQNEELSSKMQIEWNKEKPEGIKINEIQQKQTASLVEQYLSHKAEQYGIPAIVRIVILEYGIHDEELQDNFGRLRTAIEQILHKGAATKTAGTEAEGLEPGDVFSRRETSVERSSRDCIEPKSLDREKVHLCFDISMGFRSLPMYIYTFASYLTRVRPEMFQLHMYYGMGDGRQKEVQLNRGREAGSAEGRDSLKVSNALLLDEREAGTTEGGDNTPKEIEWCPLVNLQQVDVLMQWINVVNEFRRYGSVRGLTELFEAHPDWNLQIRRRTAAGTHAGKTQAPQTDLKHIFERFDYATNSNNLKLLEESIEDVIAIASALEQPESEKIPQEARLLLSDISKDFQNRFGRYQEVSYGQSYLTIRLAAWFYEQGHIGNAAIALQEGMITYALERYPELFGVTKEDDIFEYELRKDKTGQFAKISHEGDSAMLAFDSIRKHIRNVNSHILREEMSDADILDNKQKLKQLIDYMVEEVKKKEGEIVHKDGSRPLRQIFQQYQDVIQKRKRQEAELTRYKEQWFAAKAWDDVEAYVQGTVLGDALWRRPFEEALVALNRAEPKKGMISPDHETVQNPWIKLVYDLRQQEQEEQKKKEEERRNLEQEKKSDTAPMVQKGGDTHPGASVKIDKGKLSGKLLNFMGTHQSQVLDGFEALWEQRNLQKSDCETREDDD